MTDRIVIQYLVRSVLKGMFTSREWAVVKPDGRKEDGKWKMKIIPVPPYVAKAVIEHDGLIKVVDSKDGKIWADACGEFRDKYRSISDVPSTCGSYTPPINATDEKRRFSKMFGFKIY